MYFSRDFLYIILISFKFYNFSKEKDKNYRCVCVCVHYIFKLLITEMRAMEIERTFQYDHSSWVSVNARRNSKYAEILWQDFQNSEEYERKLGAMLDEWYNCRAKQARPQRVQEEERNFKKAPIALDVTFSSE